VTDSARILDEALILGHPSFKSLCSSIVDELAALSGGLRVHPEPMALLGLERIREIAGVQTKAQNFMERIPLIERPSIAQFLSHIFWKGPHIISGLLANGQRLENGTTLTFGKLIVAIDGYQLNLALSTQILTSKLS